MSPGPIFHLSFPRVPSQSGSPSPPSWELEGGCWLMSRRKEPVSVFIMRNKYIEVLKEHTVTLLTEPSPRSQRHEQDPGHQQEIHTDTDIHIQAHTNIHTDTRRDTHTGTDTHTFSFPSSRRTSVSVNMDRPLCFLSL